MARYSTRVTSVGGRNGAVASNDGNLSLPVSLPKTLGGRGDATNPEQLFAAGYAACFGNALIHAAQSQGIKLDEQAYRVAAEVGLRPSRAGSFELSVMLEVSVDGLYAETLRPLVAIAHQMCPYSNAVKGNIDVQINLV